MKFKKFFKFSLKALPFFLVAAVVLSVVFFPKAPAKAQTEKRVVRIWNVDTFEGGKGSRTSFLRRVALKAEKQNDGVYYLISGYTLDGANSAFEEGKKPDILSFGVGLSSFAEQSLPLSFRFAGGETDSGCLAYPWCGGGYYLFSKTENFEEAGATAVSKGGQNLAEVAAKLAGVTGECVESSAAYVGFLSGKYRYLFGTQRDLCRFQSRGATVYSKPATQYCDLYQYISVLSAEKRKDCNAFVETLLSEEVQSWLPEIGMTRVNAEKGTKTVSVFSDREALLALTQSLDRADFEKYLNKFLKTV